jgi:hypothetical protein
MSSTPFQPTTTPGIERANRLISVRTNPGYLDIIRISQELVDSATAISVDFGGWDPQQVVVLKCRAQAAKEHHACLFARINEAIREGVAEQASSTMPAKTAADAVDQGDFVRQEVLTKFDEMDESRPAGSYESVNWK